MSAMGISSSSKRASAIAAGDTGGRVPPRLSMIGFSMTGSEDAKGLAVSLGELHVEASPSREEEIGWHGSGDAAAADDDNIWDDASDSEGHGSILDREWAHRQNQFLKMGYRDGITDGQKDAAQEGFNAGFRQSVHVGYKWVSFGGSLVHWIVFPTV